MLVKFNVKGKPALINVRHVTGVRMDLDKRDNQLKTKLFIVGGDTMFVDEELNVVHKLINEALEGTHIEQYDYEVIVPREQPAPYLDNQFQSNFENHERMRKPYREPAYRSPRYNNNYDDRWNR